MARYATEDRRRVDFRMRSKDVQFLDAIATNSLYNNTRTAALEEVLGLVRYLSRLDNLLEDEDSMTWEVRNASMSLAKIKRVLEDGKAV